MTCDDNHDGDQPETSNPLQPIPPPTSQQIPHTVSFIKLPILKKREYDIWAMKMKHYLCHTHYPIWQVIQNDNGHVSVTTDTNGMIMVLPPKTAEEVVAREMERKARTTLLMALPEDHLAKFHKMADAKEMWEAIKSRFDEMMNPKRCRNTLNFDDLYNNLRVFERDVKRITASSSSNTQNVAFVSADNTSSTNDVSTAYSVSSPSVSKSQKEGSPPYTDEVIHSFFANQSSAPQLDCDDLEQINDDDLKKMDLKWQVVMISIRNKKFHKRTGRKLQFDTRDIVGFDKTKVECFNCHKIGHFARDCRAKWNQDSRRRDGGNSGFDNEVQSCSKTCAKSYARLKKLYDEQRDKLGDASVEITAYTLALKKSVFMNKECDIENTPINDRYAEGMHTVPPPMTGNYMPFGPDIEIDYSKFTYGPKQTSVNESDAKTSEYASSDSDSSVEPSTSVPELVVNESKFEENVNETCTPNHYPKIEKQDRHSHTRKGLGYTFTRKSCFVCGSFSHLIRDCDFHEKRMAKQAALTKSKEKNIGQQANRQVWNNVQRVNHQNKFVPSSVLTETGKILVNAARQNFSRQAALTSTASKVNNARPFVNDTRPKFFYKSHSPNKRPLHNKTAQRNTFANHKVNTVNTSLSAVKGNGDTAVKASAGCN
nr:hypothetical protein [Tanacetum cinerariifolium]